MGRMTVGASSCEVQCELRWSTGLARVDIIAVIATLTAMMGSVMGWPWRLTWAAWYIIVCIMFYRFVLGDEIDRALNVQSKLLGKMLSVRTRARSATIGRMCVWIMFVIWTICFVWALISSR
jgi:hypothetical protein